MGRAEPGAGATFSARARRAAAAVTVVAASVVVGLVASPPASASGTISVTTTADVVDPDDGVLSLREAVDLANTQAGDDTIALGAGLTYPITRCAPAVYDYGTLVFTEGASTVVVQGNGSTVDQTCTAGQYRNAIAFSSSRTSLVLNDLSVTHAGMGVTLFVASGVPVPSLTLDHVTIDGTVGDCIWSGAAPVRLRFTTLDSCGGAAIAGDVGPQASADVQDTTVTGSAGGFYGLIRLFGPANFERTSIHDNYGAVVRLNGFVTMSDTHFDHNGGDPGKGAYFYAKGITAQDSTFDRNVSPPHSAADPSHTTAGLWVEGDVDLARVSVSGNVGDGSGLLVYRNAPGGARTVKVVGSAVNDNISDGSPTTRQTAGLIVGTYGSVADPNGSVTVDTTSITNNEAADNAGLYAAVPTTIARSTVSRNEVTPGGTQHPAGALVVESTLTMERSTVNGNIVRTELATGATPSAGALRADSALLQYVTITQNTGDVGGLVILGSGSLNHMTIADNHGSVARHLAAAGGTLMIASAFSSPPGAAGPSCALIAVGPGPPTGTIGSGGFDFVSDATCPFVPFGGDVVDGGDPLLEPLRSIGGATQTRLPAPGSPLRDRIPVSRLPLCEDTDQRGVARPQGNACDIGAVEAEGAQFHALSPSRLLDTRVDPALAAPHPLQAGAPQALVVTVGAIPPTASAVVLNVTVTGSTDASYLTVWPGGTSEPQASSINFGPGQTIPNLVTAKVGAEGKVMLATNTGSTDVVVDLFGYYDDGTGPGDRWNGLDPVRVLDSRTGTGGWSGRLVAGTPRDVTVAGTLGIPASATTIVANVTVTGSDAGSFVRAWPAGSAEPSSSNLNFAAGQTIANGVIMPIGPGGAISVATAVGATDLVIDVVGWFGRDSGDRFFPVVPTRVLDDRVNVGAIGPWSPGQTRAVLASVGGGPIAADATAVVANMTVTNGTSGSFLSVFPHGSAKPTASTINFGPGETIANQATIPLTQGQLDVYNHLGQVDVLADVVGYYVAT